jgi:CO/xanthine dehydrogenase FAD-binding subunit
MIDESRFLDLKAESPLQVVYEAPGSPEVLRRTLAGPLTWQQRNEITVRRALRSPAQAPVWVAALLAWGAVLVCEGEEQPLSDFLLRCGTQPWLEVLRVPLDSADRTWGESHVGRSPADLPIVAAVAVVEWTDGLVQAARLALTGVWGDPARLAPSADMLIGGRLDDEQLGQVVSAVHQEVSPPDDFLGSETYRREMASVLTRRALEKCREEYHG